jgi:hypothetical protein
MSYELVFWKKSAGHELDPRAVHEALAAGPVDRLLAFPIDNFLAAVSVAFPGTTREMNGDEEWGGVGGMDEPRSAGRIPSDAVGQPRKSRLSASRTANLGAPLYDPQKSERFDSWTDK